MSCFADSSALVKLYIPEPGYEQIRKLDELVISQLARVEVTAAIWKKYWTHTITAEEASLLSSEFEADYYGTPSERPRFSAVEASDLVLDAAARLARVHGLRGYDSVQLASAMVVHSTNPECDTFAAFDTSLRKAAVGEGFYLLPGA